MADGGMNIEIDERLAEQIRAVADAMGMTAEEYATSMLRAAVDADWAEDERRWEEYLRTGESYDAETVMAEFLETVARGVAKRT
jgi:antitoxin component of RelBE/YafQ-DinJ toxin-antitoxin module